jgi:hypothetical protein
MRLEQASGLAVYRMRTPNGSTFPLLHFFALRAKKSGRPDLPKISEQPYYVSLIQDISRNAFNRKELNTLPGELLEP